MSQNQNRTMNDWDLIQKQLPELTNDTTASLQDFELREFYQGWPNSGGAFAKPGMVYCDVITYTHVCVLLPDKENSEAMVFFDGKFGYKAPMSSMQFAEDLERYGVCSVHEHNVYWAI